MSSDNPRETVQQSEANNAGLPPSTGWHKTFSALRNPNYRYFYSGQTVSLIGTWTRTAALGWVAFQFTHSEFLLGIVFMLNSLPIFLLAVYAGSLADRIPKIRIFTLTSWFSLLSSLTLALMLFRGPVHIGVLMIFSSLWGLSVTFEMPSRQTLMVELVGKKDLVNAIALNSAMVNSTRVIGPAIGGLLLASFGAAWCFLLDAMSYLAVLYAIHKIELPASHYAPQKVKVDWKYTLEGFKYLKTNSTIAQTVTLLFIMGLGGWAYQSQLSAFAVTQLNMDARGYGWLLALNGLAPAPQLCSSPPADLVSSALKCFIPARPFMELSSFSSVLCIDRSGRPAFLSSPGSASSCFFPSETASSKPNPPIACGEG